jgi:hypothetical protein
MISREMFQKIIDAVLRAGGGLDDVKDLVGVWERLDRAHEPRADAIRREAQTVRCVCTAGVLQSNRDGRCARCFGQTGGK